MYFLVPQLHNQDMIPLCNFPGNSFGIWIKCIRIDSVISKSNNADSNTQLFCGYYFFLQIIIFLFKVDTLIQTS